ncbi:MAG: hypothetical protein QNJ68_14525 [Microcoleaceae cyanobacterium MO_207.B10]|nr:hypothetical protein [Microcoleaceae cyanobacterium MO_207.B10]
MENTEASSTDLNHPQSQHNWLQIAEYIALGGSVGGSGLAWFFEQVLFAATPITLALALNIFNRKQFEEKIQKHTDNQVEYWTTEINSVVHHIETLPTKISEHGSNFTLNSSNNLSNVPTVAENLEYSTNTKEDWETINLKFSDIDEELQSLKDLTTDLQQRLLDGLQSINSTSTQNEIDELQQQVTRLQELNRDVVKPYFIRLIRAVKQLQEANKS